MHICINDSTREMSEWKFSFVTTRQAVEDLILFEYWRYKI